MVTATERFVASHSRHAGSLAFLLTSDEEGAAVDGTRRVMDLLEARGEKIDFCVVGEPTSHERLGDTIKIGRRGSLSGRLGPVHGVPGHIASPQALQTIRCTALRPPLRNWWPGTGTRATSIFQPTSVQVSNLSAGTGAPNVIPGEMKVRFNLRFSTEQTVESLQLAVHEILDRHRVNYTLEWFVSGLPFFTQPGLLTDAVSAAVSDVTGVQPEFSTTGGDIRRAFRLRRPVHRWWKSESRTRRSTR